VIWKFPACGQSIISRGKLDAHGKPQEYALFIQDNKIIDSRAGVVIDQCYKQTFEHFDLPTPAAKKAGP